MENQPVNLILAARAAFSQAAALVVQYNTPERRNLVASLLLRLWGEPQIGVRSAEAMASEPVDWEGQFRMKDGETLAGLLATYDDVAARTDELVATADLNASHPLPIAPWFEAGKSWSVRRVLLHIIAETAQHAGHADIIRESLDGQKTMG